MNPGPPDNPPPEWATSPRPNSPTGTGASKIPPAPNVPASKGSSAPRNSRSTATGSIIPVQEAIRIVKIHRAGEGKEITALGIVGAGILIDSTHILTCRRVIELAISQDAVVGGTVLVSLAISTTNGFSEAKIIQFGSGDAVGDLALLETSGSMLPPGAGKARFATPLRYNDRQFGVLGFSDGAGEELAVEGSFVGPEDRDGLVLMPGEKIRNKGGFHGTPVWSPELEAFVGLVTSSLETSWPNWRMPSASMV
ncbi:MAG TPA: hypothetical protein VIK53_08095 [Verrucomicrobiae bacterium]